MKTLSAFLKGAIPFQNANDYHNETCYTAHTKVADYICRHLSLQECTLYNTSINSYYNDIITVINENKGIYFLLSLKNSIQFSIVDKILLLHENHFIFITTPALYINANLIKGNQYNILLFKVPPTWSIELNTEHTASMNFLQANNENKIASLPKYPTLAEKETMQTITETQQTPDLWQQLFSKLLPITYNHKHNTPLKLKDAQAIYKVKEYIDKELNDLLTLRTKTKLTVSDISDKAGVSEHIIKNYFKEIYWSNVHDYINEYKINLSLSLLTENITLAYIATVLGMNVKTYNVLFKKVVGISVKEYLNRAGNFR